MIDFGEFFDGFRFFSGAPMGVFTFIVLLALISGGASWLKARAVQETVREAIRAGTPLDPAVIRELKGDGPDAAPQNRALPGYILIAVAAALVLFGFGIGIASEDPTVKIVFASIAVFPALIGVAFLVASRHPSRD